MTPWMEIHPKKFASEREPLPTQWGSKYSSFESAGGILIPALFRCPLRVWDLSAFWICICGSLFSQLKHCRFVLMPWNNLQILEFCFSVTSP